MEIPTKTLALLLLPLVGVSQAAVILEEDFESFTAGDLHNQGDWTVTSIATTTTTNHVVDTTGGLSYSGGAVNHSGGSNLINTSLGAEEYAYTDFASQNGDAVYMSFLLNRTDGGFFMLGLKNGAPTSTSNLAGAGGRFGVTDVRARIGSNVFNSSNRDVAETTPATEHGSETILYVGKLFKSTSGTAQNYDRFSFTMNPTSLSEPTTWDATGSFDTGLNSVDTLWFRGPAESNADWEVDMLRVGTTYDAVVVPEPGNFALISALLLGAMAVARRRRR